MKRTIILSAVISSLMMVSCKKSTFLDANPDQSMSVPTTLADFQAIISNDDIMDGSADALFGILPAFGEAASDNYYLTPFGDSTIASLQGSGSSLINLYSWNDDLYSGGNQFYDWDFPYRGIFYANEVLDGLAGLKPGPDQLSTFNTVKGDALFYRAHMFYVLAQIFAPVYDSATASTDWGLPLRLTADVNEKISRSTVQRTYDQIINDLRQAIQLLPPAPSRITLPSKAAAYGLMARLYQTVQAYDSSFFYANACLQLQNALMDYNSLDSTSANPVPQYNAEVIFPSNLIYINDGGLFTQGLYSADSTLYNSYQANDLRRTVFFQIQPDGSKPFVGSYDGTALLFGGIATDEMYLIRAECNARLGFVNAAMNDLNALLVTRWATGTFNPYSAVNASDALTQILAERRKELPFRGLRWTDLRRLNKEGANITLTRILNGPVVYTLAPKSLHYAFLIPPDVISFNPKMPQNPR